LAPLDEIRLRNDVDIVCLSEHREATQERQQNSDKN